MQEAQGNFIKVNATLPTFFICFSCLVSLYMQNVLSGGDSPCVLDTGSALACNDVVMSINIFEIC